MSKIKEELLEKLIQFEVGSLDWLEARAQNITATEISSLFAMNRYKSAKKVLEDKLSPQTIWNPFVRRGRILEPAVFQAFREDMRWDVDELCPGVIFFKHPSHRLSATPDAFLFEQGEPVAVVECKTAADTRIGDWDDGVPLYYALQVHVQMICTGIRRGYIGCLGAFDPFPFIVYEIMWDERINEKIIAACGKFWLDYESDVEYTVDKRVKKDLTYLLKQNMRRCY